MGLTHGAKEMLLVNLRERNVNAHSHDNARSTPGTSRQNRRRAVLELEPAVFNCWTE